MNLSTSTLTLLNHENYALNKTKWSAFSDQPSETYITLAGYKFNLIELFLSLPFFSFDSHTHYTVSTISSNELVENWYFPPNIDAPIRSVTSSCWLSYHSGCPPCVPDRASCSECYYQPKKGWQNHLEYHTIGTHNGDSRTCTLPIDWARHHRRCHSSPTPNP